MDELDRCRPDYAINYLETIKHVFGVHGLIFVLAVDYDQLACSAKTLFGHELNFHEYFRKFAQRTISLPAPGDIEIRALARHYVSKYIEAEGKRFSGIDLGTGFEHIVEIIGALKMAPRQINEVFRIIGHVTSIHAEMRGQLPWCHSAGTILMSIFKVGHDSMYQAIGKGTENPLDVGRFLLALLKPKKAKWWILVYFIGRQVDFDEAPSQFTDFARALPVPDWIEQIEYDAKNKGNVMRRHVYDFRIGWGDSEGGHFKRIYNNIESAMTLVNEPGK